MYQGHKVLSENTAVKVFSRYCHTMAGNGAFSFS